MAYMCKPYCLLQPKLKFGNVQVSICQVPPLMDVNDLVDAALIGFDRKETITIPVLKDENQWNNFEKSRMTLLPNFSSAEVAQRYTN